MAGRNEITKEEVVRYKSWYCKENEVLAQRFKTDFSNKIGAAVLDVGCGIGDIAYWGIEQAKVYLLDRLDFSEWPTRKGHQRIKKDFFDVAPDDLPKMDSLLFAHSTQYLDEDIVQLQELVDQYAPARVFSAMNINDGFLGELLHYCRSHNIGINPEVDIPGFPRGYVLESQVQITANLDCKNYDDLFDQVDYLLMFDRQNRSRIEADFKAWLQASLPMPEFKINQFIHSFKRIDNG